MHYKLLLRGRQTNPKRDAKNLVKNRHRVWQSANRVNWAKTNITPTQNENRIENQETQTH